MVYGRIGNRSTIRTIIFFLLIPIVCFSQTKKGGWFVRIDDPYNSYTRAYVPTSIQTTASNCIDYLDSFNLKATFAVVTEYPNLHGDTLQPYLSIYPLKLAHLKALQAKGHTLAMHTPNHSTNFYNVHIDSLSTEDQSFVNNGYTKEDGIDTIVINNTDSRIYVHYWKHFPDNRYSWFGRAKIIDDDNDDDSIFYVRLIPPKCVHIALYPSVTAFKKLINEQRRQFAASGLDEPVVWIHPGQEGNYTDLSLTATLIESTGYVVTKSGNDTVTYYTNIYLSSNTYPIQYLNTEYNSAIRIDGTTYYVNFVDTVSCSVFKAKLKNYSGDGNNHYAELIPYGVYSWMWQVDPTIIKATVEELGLKMSAVYPWGRQSEYIGYNASTNNEQYFKWAHQWAQVILSATTTAKTAINKLVKATARHCFSGTNDHEILGSTAVSYAQIDSLYDFINTHRDMIKICSFIDLQDSLYNINVNPYENILSSFDLDLNADESLDGWDINSSDWLNSGLIIENDTNYINLNNYGIECENLWGVEKGDNIVSIYIKSTNADSCKITITEYTHTAYTGTRAAQVKSTIKYIKNLTSNYVKHVLKFNISETTDFITIEIATNSKLDINIQSMKPRMAKYSNTYYDY